MPRLPGWVRSASIGLALLIAGGATASVGAAPAPNEAAPRGVPASDKVRALLDLINDPDVRAYLAQRESARASVPGHPDGTMATSLGDDLQGLRQHLQSLAADAPRLPEEITHARDMLTDALGRQGTVSLGLFMAAFVALGFGGELLYRWLTVRARTWLLALNLDTVQERLRAVFARLLYGLGIIASYALGSVGAFLLFDWSPLLKQSLLGYLLASVFVRLATVFGRFFLAPGAERFRVAPISTPAASFLFRRLVALALLAAFGGQTIDLLGAFGFAEISREFSADTLGIVALAILLETVWRLPHQHPPPDPVAHAISHGVAGRDLQRSLRAAAKTGASVIFVLLWALWVADAMTAFWLVAFGVGLPAALVLLRASIRHVLRHSDDPDVKEAHRLELVFVERGLRSLLIVAAALELGRLLGLDVVSLTMQDTVVTRIERAALSVVVVVLVADFLWHVIRVLIDRKLSATGGRVGIDDDGGHAARLQTLLPILKNLLLAVLVVLAAMMVLAAMGVEIGPLVASAGVVGVAIGFGAQTLVRDIISGVFYLIDDAFRVGEYIQSGTYKGTVESFSLRSVKLRHQRGALYTVPFGVLGAVQNQSRDWVVDKIVLNVPYDTDLEKVRKIVRRIGETLAEDPELGPEIIKPIKLQGVAQFGDFAIQLQTKMMTKPGDVQFVARRRALVMIKQAFEASGIGFAMPTVQVSGEGGASAAAAQKGFAVLQAAKVEGAA